MHFLYIFIYNIIFFLRFTLHVYFCVFKFYSMIPLYICFTLVWIPFSQLSIHNVITCVHTYLQFPKFCIFGQVFFIFPNLVPIALFCLSTQLLFYEIIY